MNQTSAAYYEELQHRIRSLLNRVEDQLPRHTTELIFEFVDANECGLALETLSEMLRGSKAKTDSDVAREVRDLAATIGLDFGVADQLEGQGT